jgi:hypothetical protein
MIQREETQWGVRLVLKPFTHPKEHAEMYAEADISLPRPGHRSEIKFFFSGTTVQSPLRASDMIVWMEHLKALSDAAREEAAKLKAQSEKPKRKK